MEKDLEGLTVVKLREEAKKYPEIAGVHAMKKNELIEAIIKASGQPVKRKKKTEEGLGDQKSELKKELKALKVQRENSLESRDRKTLKSIRARLKRIKRKTRRMGRMASRSS